MLLVFDTETTGLTLHPAAHKSKKPRIIEFGAALLSLKNGEVVETANILINPQEVITAEITKITGITNADVEDAPTFLQCLPQILHVFEQATCVCAHNLPFDKAIIHGEMARADLCSFPWPDKEFCTVGLYKDDWGRNPKLLELYEAVLGKPLAQTHRALDDVMALVEIIQKENLWTIAASHNCV